MIRLVETYLGKKAQIKKYDFQKTDMMATWADVGKAGTLLGWKPKVPLSEGIQKTVQWYLDNKAWAKNLVIDMAK
jgi:UDP-glucuronate 4-epimerase